MCCNEGRAAGSSEEEWPSVLMIVKRWINQEEIFERGFEEVPQIRGRGRAFLSRVDVKETGLCSLQLGEIKIWAVYGQVSKSECQKIVRILDAMLRCSSDNQCKKELIRFAF